MHSVGQLSLADFYSADAEALRAKYKQIEHLIGLSHHSLSEGTYCETLLKEFLRRTLPREVSVDTGFIRRVTDENWSDDKLPLPPDIATPQLDIIIHDTQHYAPLLRAEDFVVVLPQAVKAVIEVKKTLDHGALTDALENVTKTTRLLRKWRIQPYHVFTGIFAFGLDDGLAPPTKTISDSFKNCFQKALEARGGDCEMPRLLIALPRFALQQDSNPLRYNLCPTAPDDSETPNVAAQFLVFALSYFISMGGQGRALVYPEDIKSRKKPAFELVMPSSPQAPPSS